jgi:predicted S18 family serine protease
MTKPLSPAAQAVLDAALPAYDDETLYAATVEQHAAMIAAAALRAAAERNEYKPDMRDEMEVMFSEGWNSHRKELLAIADELDVH